MPDDAASTPDTVPGDSGDVTEPHPTQDLYGEPERLPFGFILTIVMAGLYVGYRIIQLVVKGIEALT